jgi:uncharacterized protein YifN (PemK superfamily)
MAITFVPKPGQVLMCNFDSDGFIRPEMQKIRHCVVISPRGRRHTGCCIIVPISGVAPDPVEHHHVLISANKYSFFKKDQDVWAKGDMVTHVAFARLDRVLDQGRYASPSVSAEDFKAIQAAVLNAMGLTTQPRNDKCQTEVKITSVQVTERIELKNPQKD